VYSGGKVANRNVSDFGWGIAREAASPRPPISLSTMVARTHMYTYDGIGPSFKGHFPSPRCQTLT
jgi:hypothetical protein